MLEQNITAYLANLLKLKTSQINAAIKLIDEGNTIPLSHVIVKKQLAI